jgi:hypothetical protein
MCVHKKTIYIYTWHTDCCTFICRHIAFFKRWEEATRQQSDRASQVSIVGLAASGWPAKRQSEGGEGGDDWMPT